MTRAHLLASLATCLALGCGSSAPKQYDAKTIDAAEQFRKIGVAFNQAFQRNRRPPTVEDLKPFLQQQGDPATLLTSPLDGKPIVIVPGFSPDKPAAEGERSIVAYEQAGVNGKRMTVDVRGTIVFVTDDEFAKLKFAGGHKPSGG
jgi:hypothetical protein